MRWISDFGSGIVLATQGRRFPHRLGREKGWVMVCDAI